jgi:molecular chaperone Hsp33
MLEDIKRKYTTRDRFIRVLSKSGAFRAVIVRNTTTAQIAQANHNLDAMSAYFLAKTMTASTIISAFLKGEERVVVDITGDGIIEKCYAESAQVGECRGFVRKTNDNAKQFSDMSDIFGNGQMRVSRVLYNQIEPITGIIPLIKGDVSSDVAYYFHQSEQIPSAVVLDAALDKDDVITCSGGLLVQSMPGALENDIQSVAEAVSAINICSALDENPSLEDVLHKALPFDFDVIKTKPVDFYCRCNINNFKHQLLLLGADELQSMRASGHNELVCQFCGKRYYLSEQDFDDMICQIMAQRN